MKKQDRISKDVKGATQPGYLLRLWEQTTTRSLLTFQSKTIYIMSQKMWCGNVGVWNHAQCYPRIKTLRQKRGDHAPGQADISTIFPAPPTGLHPALIFHPMNKNSHCLLITKKALNKLLIQNQEIPGEEVKNKNCIFRFQKILEWGFSWGIGALFPN